MSYPEGRSSEGYFEIWGYGPTERPEEVTKDNEVDILMIYESHHVRYINERAEITLTGFFRPNEKITVKIDCKDALSEPKFNYVNLKPFETKNILVRVNAVTGWSQFTKCFYQYSYPGSVKVYTLFNLDLPLQELDISSLRSSKVPPEPFPITEYDITTFKQFWACFN